MTERLLARLRRPHDAAALVAFRVVLGTIIAISAVRFLHYGWVDELFVKPTFFFKYWGFAWVEPLPLPAMKLLFVAMALLGLAIAVGLYYRIATIAFFVLFTYVELIDVTNYLNHYYLFSLLALLLCALPLHRAWSFDAWRDATQRYQATVVRRHVEHLRRLKYRPTGGFAQFCFADGHPAVTWSVLDHERVPKLGLAALRDACRPVIVVADRPPAEVTPGQTLALDVHAVSDLRTELAGAVGGRAIAVQGVDERGLRYCHR